MSQDEIFEIEPPERQKRGGNKLLMGLGIGCGVSLLLCCGGFFFMQQWAENAFSDDPAVVVQTTELITEIDIPPQMDPQVSMDVKIPFTDQRFMTMVMYGNEEGQQFLLLAQFDNELLDETNRDDMAAQVKESLQGQLDTEQNITLDEEAAEQIERTIRDLAATFAIAKGTSDDTGVDVWYVTGTFEGRRGPVFMDFVAPTEDFTREEIGQLLDSIR